MKKSRSLAYIALSLNAIIWGAAIPIAKPLFSVITPGQFLYFRYLVAGLVSIPILLVMLNKHNLSRSKAIKIIILELVNAPALLVLYEGVKRTSAIESSLLGATSPIFTVLGGIIFLKEREEKREWIGLAISFLGTLLLSVDPIISGINGSINYSFTGNLMVLGYNVIWSIYLLIAKKLYKNLPKLLVTSIGYITLLVFFLLYLPLSSKSLSITPLFSPFIASRVLYMAILGSIIAFALYIYGQDKIEASEASLFTYLNGVVAIPASYLLLKETPTRIALIAVLIITLGVYIGEYKPLKSKKP